MIIKQIQSGATEVDPNLLREEFIQKNEFERLHKPVYDLPELLQSLVKTSGYTKEKWIAGLIGTFLDRKLEDNEREGLFEYYSFSEQEENREKFFQDLRKLQRK